MAGRILLDAGPLVAYLNARDHYHEWARQRLATMVTPLATCEAVLTEASFLLGSSGARTVLELVARGVFSFPLDVVAEAPALHHLLARYEDQPMSFADACLVRLSELFEDSFVFTLDGDFQIYRRLGRRTIPTISPPSRK